MERGIVLFSVARLKVWGFSDFVTGGECWTMCNEGYLKK